jgi:hypothetical protein
MQFSHGNTRAEAACRPHLHSLLLTPGDTQFTLQGLTSWRLPAHNAISQSGSVPAKSIVASASPSREFGCALMDSIIARIVVRPATFASQNAMTTSPSRIEVSIHNDARLFAALSAIVSHSARRAGLAPNAQQGFAEATLEACRETFPLLHQNDSKNGMLHLAIVDFADRVEVTIEHSGEALPTAGLDTFCAQPGGGSSEGISGALQGTKVDRVQYETSGGISRVILIKYSRARPLESSSSA